METKLDELFARLAAHQEGVASLRQARLVGFTEGQIRARRASGRWPLARPGVVRLPGAPVTWQSELMTGRLLLGERGVVSRTWAAAVLGLDVIDRSSLPEFTVERGEIGTIGGLLFHTTRRLDPVDVVAVRRSVASAVRREAAMKRARLVTSYRTTSASRTVIDLAPVLDDRAIGALVDLACSRGLSSPAFLARRLTALRGHGRAGTPAVEDALIDAGGHSPLERAFLAALRTAAVRRPRCQAVYRADGTFLARVDFDFDPSPLVVEVNGRRGHSSDGDRAKDARRRNELQRRGVIVLEYTYRQVLGAPEQVVAEVAAVLRRSM